NNSEQPRTAAIPTYTTTQAFERVYGSGPARISSAADHSLTLTVPPLSTVVYASAGRIPASKAAPDVSLTAPAPAAGSGGRMQVTAEVAGSAFAQLIFSARTGSSGWRPT